MKNFMESFAEKHPKAAQWIREGGLFVLFSYVVNCSSCSVMWSPSSSICC